MGRILESNGKKRSFPNLDKKFKKCIENMLMKNPDERPSIDDVLIDDVFYLPEIKYKNIVEELSVSIPHYPLV